MSEKFKTIDDFTVRLIETPDGGRQIELASEASGRLAGFPAWEHADRDLRHFIRGDIPLGTREEPFEDRDEDWRIAIFEHGGWVYVAEGTDDGNTAFRVRTTEYFTAWEDLIDQFNPALELDDLFDDTEPQA
jgi:hypothetical protein